MQYLKNSLSCIAIMGTMLLAATAVAGSQQTAELGYTPRAEAAIEQALSQACQRYPLDLAAGRRIASRIDALISNNIDPETAKTTQSTRFAGRTTLSQKVERNQPLFLDGRGAKGLDNSAPFDVYYRRGPARFYFRKMLEVEAESRLDALDVAGECESSLLRSGLLELGPGDEIGEVTPRQLLEDRDTGADKGMEVVLLQGVRLRRQFLGKPVVNSKVSVDVHPDTREVMGFKHYSWTPVSADKAEVVDQRSPKTVDQIRADLASRARPYQAEGLRATVDEVESAWYQSDEELIPVLIVKVELEDLDAEADEEPSRGGYVDLVNLLGSDSDLGVRR